MKCANYFCENNLDSFSLARISKKRVSKHNFCLNCKRQMQKVDFINCTKCGDKTLLGNFRSHCDKCTCDKYRLNPPEVCITCQ